MTDEETTDDPVPELMKYKPLDMEKELERMGERAKEIEQDAHDRVAAVFEAFEADLCGGGEFKARARSFSDESDLLERLRIAEARNPGVAGIISVLKLRRGEVPTDDPPGKWDRGVVNVLVAMDHERERLLALATNPLHETRVQEWQNVPSPSDMARMELSRDRWKAWARTFANEFVCMECKTRCVPAEPLLSDSFLWCPSCSARRGNGGKYPVEGKGVVLTADQAKALRSWALVERQELDPDDHVYVECLTEALKVADSLLLTQPEQEGATDGDDT